MEEEQQENLNLDRYLEILLRWWWLIVLVPVVLGLGVYFYGKSFERTVYTASAKILVQESAGSSVPTFVDLARSLDLAPTYKELLTSGDLLQQVVDELPDEQKQQVTAGALTGMVKVSSIEDTPLLRITVTSDNSDLSINVTNTLANVFQRDRQTDAFNQLYAFKAYAESEGISLSDELVAAEYSALSGISIEDRAKSASASVEPPVIRNTILGIVLGLFLGVLAAFFMEYINRTIRSAEQIERMFGLPNMKSSVIGIIYRWKSKEVPQDEVVMRGFPDSVYSEMFRQVRTSFQFVASTNPGKAFMITSAAPQEGKTTVTANLGVGLAQGGARVIIVEGDLRRPSLHRLFDVDSRAGPNSHNAGLSSLLADTNMPLESALYQTETPRLKVLAAGPVPPNPADLLGSDRMPQIIDELKEQCDYLLIDSPPILSAADPMILASQVDGVMLVATLGESRSDDFNSAVQQIQRSETPLLGYVLNKMRTRKFGYGGYRYQHYYYYYSREATQGADGTGSVDGSGRSRRSPLWRRVRRRLTGSSRRR